MKTLYTLDELLAMQTNGWSCAECGRIWLDAVGPSLSRPGVQGDSDCAHPSIRRALVRVAT